MLNPTEHISTASLKSLKCGKLKTFLAFKLSGVVFIMLMNVKMPTIVGILTFMSIINYMFSWDEDEIKKFYLRARNQEKFALPRENGI